MLQSKYICKEELNEAVASIIFQAIRMAFEEHGVGLEQQQLIAIQNSVCDKMMGTIDEENVWTYEKEKEYWARKKEGGAMPVDISRLIYELDEAIEGYA